jgi:SAM-dependent methyltransferase
VEAKKVKQVGNVKLNLDFYTGNDQYSDGDIENEILEILKSGKNIADVLSEDNRWPILYHLSPLRRNLLEWMPISEHATVLEIGAGCGAVTGLLCEKARKVTAVELSKRRATIIAHRYKDYKNLEIIVGNISDIKFDDKYFDYVTLIGVLEYAALFTNSHNPYLTFLKNIYERLCVGGKLIIAIENKFGLKYWAGAREDHTGRLFDSLEDYPNNSDVYTFSKDELTKLLKQAGFTSLQYYYPFPDYKLPTQIFSDVFLPKIGDIQRFSPNYDRERFVFFNEKLVWENVIKNNMFHFFSNSFLVICGK